MKKLFFALLVLNLVLWLWGKRQELAPELAMVERGVGIIRLLDDAEVAARREQAADEAARPAAQPTESQEAVAAVPQALARSDGSGEQSTFVEPPPVTAGADGEATQDESPDGGTTPVAVAALEPPGSEDLARPDAGQNEAPSDWVGGEATEPAATAAGAAVASVAEAPVDAGDLPVPVTPGPETAPAELPPPPAMPGYAASVPETAPGPEPRDSRQAEPAAVPPAVVTARTRSVCESVGPFRDRTAAERHAAALRPPFAGVGVREEVSARPARHWVVAPASKDADPAYRRALGDAGVQDAWRVKSGPLAGRLSLGAFQVEENARKHVAALAARGIAVELQTVKEQERQWWIDYERPEDTPSPARSSAGAESPRQVVERRCSRVAAP